MIERSRVVGVLGGMGSLATMDFCSRLVAATLSHSGRDEIRLIIDNNPFVPDRNLAVAGEGPSPGPVLASMAQGLVAVGAELLTMPCNTAHIFANEISSSVAVPFLNMIDATTAEILSLTPKPSKIGLIGTDGCLASGIYQNRLIGSGIEILLPEARHRQEFMSLLYSLKVARPDDLEHFELREIALSLIDRGAEAIVTGCSEISLVLKQKHLSVPLIDSTDALVMHTAASVFRCDLKL